MFQNNLRQIKVILYRLKRSFGETVYFHMPTTNTNDVTTGQITRVYTDIKVRRAIVLPVKQSRDFAYDLAYIASNKNFTYGGFFDKSTRLIIVRNSDLKSNTPALDWSCTINDREYTVKDLDKTEDNAGYIMTCTALDRSNDG